MRHLNGRCRDAALLPPYGETIEKYGQEGDQLHTVGFKLMVAAVVAVLAALAVGISTALAGTSVRTVIDSAPSGAVSSTTATITFHASGAASFTCKLDAGAFQTCATASFGSVTYTNLAQGAHTVLVRNNTGSGGSTEPQNPVAWTVDTVAPAAPK